MKNINHALEAKAQKTLNALVRYSEGVMTRKQFIELQQKRGSKVEISTKNRIQYNRIKYNRMDHKQQQEYEKKCSEKVTCYNLLYAGVSYFTEITKTEYDYFLSLQN